MFKNVIFDLDGTLLDTTEGIVESVEFAAAELGFQALSHETLLRFIGPPIQQSFMTHYHCDKKQAQEAANLFRDYYKARALLKARPYEGIYELCQRLKDEGIRMAVATYKREDYALTLLKHFHFDDYCSPMHGADNENVLKKEDIIRLCMDEMGGSPEDSALVGDTWNDALGAMNAGIAFVAVSYGFGFKAAEDLEDYSFVGLAHKPAQIADFILENQK